MNNYKIINPDTWHRTSTYLWFSSFANPCYGMDVKIDVTKVLAYSHEHKSSFFINFLFILVNIVIFLTKIKHELNMFNKN